MYKATVLVFVAAILLLALAWRLEKRPTESQPTTADASPTATTLDFPALIDLGMGKCVACKAMKPVLDELKDEYEGRCRIEIIDIGERPDQGDRYGVDYIPTQLFFDRHGRQVYRHVGFMPKKDIVAKLREIGVE